MTLKTIAILSPGDMGHAVGGAFVEHGYSVITCLQGRSDRTRKLAIKGNIKDLPSIEDLVSQADLVLSILVPAEALGTAGRVADALYATGASPYFADCNAVSPQTSQAMASIINAAGGVYIDAGIIGGPPNPTRRPRFYVSGEHAHVMTELEGRGISVRYIGDAIGRASAIKMCYAALTKGTSALHIAILSAAEVLGLTEELHSELEYSQPDILRSM